jgi:long-chain acyl-CoA synthetase
MSLVNPLGPDIRRIVTGRHVFIPAFDPELWLRTVVAERVSDALLVPPMISMLVNHPELTSHDLSSVRLMLYGASLMPRELLRQAMDALPCDFSQGYGMTEAAPIGSCLLPEDHRRGAGGDQPYADGLRSAGRAVVGVDAEARRSDGTAADVGEPGEIWVRGPNVMKGYWNPPEKTAAVLDAA